MSKKNTIYNTKLPIQEVLLIFYKLLLGVKYSHIKMEVYVSERTLVTLRKNLRNEMKKFYKRKKNKLLGE
jgi:hypothetical protein